MEFTKPQFGKVVCTKEELNTLYEASEIVRRIMLEVTDGLYETPTIGEGEKIIMSSEGLRNFFDRLEKLGGLAEQGELYYM